jgi:putative PEP-CTERM system histidine kinase
LASFFVATGWVIDLDEWRREPQRYNDLRLPEWLAFSPRCWLLVPLLQGEAQGEELVGFVVIGQPRAPRTIEWEDRDLLKSAARQLAVYVALVQTSEALLEARQFETFHRLAAFLVHDLKNVSGQLGMVLSNAARHGDNPEFIASAFNTMGHARERLDRTLAQLRNAQPEQVSRAQRVDLGEAVSEAVERSKDKAPVPQLSISAAPQVIAEKERLVTVLTHLLRNAQEAISDSGQVQIRLYQRQKWAYIEVEDNGHGMDERFMRESLFRPFQTTKGNAGMGIGVYEAREYISQLGGRIDVSSTLGVGTTFTIQLVSHDTGS